MNDEHAEIEPLQRVLRFRGGPCEVNAADGQISVAQFDDGTFQLYQTSSAVYLTRAQLAQHVSNLRAALANWGQHMATVRQWNAANPDQAAVEVVEGRHFDIGPEGA